MILIMVAVDEVMMRVVAIVMIMHGGDFDGGQDQCGGGGQMGRWRRPVGWINLAVVLVLDVAVMEEEEMLVAVELEVAV